MKRCVLILAIVFLLIACTVPDDPLAQRTVDEVIIGNLESEFEHDFDGVNFRSGFHNNGNWRDARGGYYQYTLKTGKNADLALWVRYWGNDQGDRIFDIYIDEKHLAGESIGGKWNEATFFNVEYPIPVSMIKGKKSVDVKFEAIGDHVAGGIYGLRMLKNK